MSDPTIVRFFHVDDEPEKVWWIPGALRTDFYQRYRDRFPKADAMAETGDDEHRFVFTFLLLGGGKDGRDVRVEYTLIDHENLLPPDLSTCKDALFILDLMRPDTKGQLIPVAIKTYLGLKDAGVPPERMFVLTAYGKRVPRSSFPGLPADHELEKPVHPDRLISIIFKALPEVVI